jgi:hypothetical protein
MPEEFNAGPSQPNHLTTNVAPVFIVAEGLNADGSLLANYQRRLRYAVDYFGNYGPYYVYLLGPDSEQNVREIFRKRAEFRVNAQASATAEEQIEEFLQRPNVIAEINAVLAGQAQVGLSRLNLRFLCWKGRCI